MDDEYDEAPLRGLLSLFGEEQRPGKLVRCLEGEGIPPQIMYPPGTLLGQKINPLQGGYIIM